MRQQVGCVESQATYSFFASGSPKDGSQPFVKVLNECITKNGDQRRAETYATSISPSNDKVLVHFSKYFGGNYWILDLEEDYSFVVVGEPCRKFAWILSRERDIPKTDPRIQQKINLLKQQGYETRDMIFRGETDLESSKL